MSSPHVAEIEIPADSRFVATTRNFVADEARAAGWLDETRIDDLRLIVSESVTNALRAQADRHIDALIHVRTARFDDRLEISVTDSAGGFDVPSDLGLLPEPDLQSEGGFGLPLIEALSDEAHVTPTNGGTVVRVVVRRD